MARNYKDEYKKFQDSPAQKKNRAALNRENYKRGTYGNNDGLDVSHTKNGTKLEKSSANKGRKEKSRMAGSKRKQNGGYLKGKSHNDGGIPAIVGGSTPVELEGGEYIIRKSSVDRLGKGVLEEINKKGRIPTMANGGKESSTKSKMKTEKPIVYKSKPKTKKKKRAAGDDSWSFGEMFTKAGRERAKRRRTGKRAKKTLTEYKEKSFKGIEPMKGITDKEREESYKVSGKIKKKDLAGVKETKGGMYPKYKKKSKSAGSFRDAFKAARKGGKKTFEFQGRKYTSETAEEKKARINKRKANEASATQVTQGDDTVVAQMGGMMPHKAPMRTYKHGGQVSTHSPKASVGDAISVHSHSGYKAGE